MNRIEQILGYVPCIIFDDGHGENTSGKQTPTFSDGTSIKENCFNKPVTNMMMEIAIEMGFEVFHDSPEDNDVSLKVRTDRANMKFAQLKKKYPNIAPEKLAILISTHFNAQDDSWGGTTGGIETYFYPGSKSGERLASCIQKYLIQGTPQRNRGVKSANFHMLRESHMPAALIENGFMDHEIEAKLMVSRDYQAEVASETMKGICDYFGVPYELPQKQAAKEIDYSKLLGFIAEIETAAAKIKKEIGGMQ
ncbi:MAG: N-acetylmuramoyl-L-alanine amidase family protein [Bacillota bacterium]